MNTDTRLPFDLPAVRRKKLTVDFNGGNQSSDAGLLLLREAERRLGVCWIFKPYVRGRGAWQTRPLESSTGLVGAVSAEADSRDGDIPPAVSEILLHNRTRDMTAHPKRECRWPTLLQWIVQVHLRYAQFVSASLRYRHDTPMQEIASRQEFSVWSLQALHRRSSPMVVRFFLPQHRTVLGSNQNHRKKHIEQSFLLLAWFQESFFRTRLCRESFPSDL
jgi:hypothetical protein